MNVVERDRLLVNVVERDQLLVKVVDRDQRLLVVERVERNSYRNYTLYVL